MVALPLLAGTITYTATFTRQDLTISKVNNYDVVELNGCLPMVTAGQPRLPHVVQSFAIPAGTAPTRVEITTEEWTVLPGTYNVVPSQPDVPLPMPNRTFTLPNYPPDPKVYGSNDPYPEAKIRLLTPGTMSGYRIANVELCPVRYLPASGQLQLATRMSFRLDYTTGGTEPVLASDRQREHFANMVRRLVVNPNAVNGFAPRCGRSGAVTTLPPGQYDYVVVTEAPMDTVFQRLAAWKTARGVPGNVVLVSWISTNYTGYDLQEKIRNFIIDAHQTWGTMYVLLGGQGDPNSSGQNIVPTRYANTGTEDNEPCDHYYECLDGTWDANGNHIYGERADVPDLYADVYVGRAPVYNIAMAQNFVRKVLSYEQAPPTGFIKKMSLLTGILWSSYEERPMQESICRMTPSGWSDQRLYERTGALSTAAVRESTNIGLGMGNWEGHGNESGIYMSGGSVPVFVSSDADALTNDVKGGVIISIACDCGGWDMVTGGDCFAEHFVNNTHGGAIATIMNSRYGYGAIGPGGGYVPGPSERYDTTFCAAIINWGLYHTGEALGYAKSSWAPYADSLYGFAETRYCAYDLNLIGDPEAPVWTDEPATCNVAHAGVITIGNHIQFPVTVTASGGAPIAGARVVAHKGNEVNETGTTNGSGQVTLDVSPTTPGQMSLLVCAHNYFVHLDTVQVISTSRYVSYLRSSIYDPAPGGNNDGIINPGESFHIPTWLKNYGTLTANSVTGKLRTHTAGATVTDSTKSFGDIAAGDSVQNSGGFGMTVAGGLANGYAISCSLLCKDALDSTWVSLITFYVGAPIVGYSSFSVRDSLGAQPNGKLDPGETADLVVTLHNTGIGNAFNAHAVLRSTDARLAVLDSLAVYGLIPHDSDGTNDADHFCLSADGGIIPETPIPCTLVVTADGGYSAKTGFVLVVGEVRTVDPIHDGPRIPARYWSYDDVDSGFVEHPTYNWVEINGVGTRLTYSQNDVVLLITIPSAFGPLKYYGQRYTQMSISADGWISPGNNTTSNFTNTALPSSAAPVGAICANWDDLDPYPDGAGYIYDYHDVANHRFIIEWDSVEYWSQTSYRDKFEIIFSDTTSAPASGDNVIVFQYKTANLTTNSTVGNQDQTQAIAILGLYDGAYTRGAAAITAGHAIKLIAEAPQTGVSEPDVSTLTTNLRPLAVAPNPFTGCTRILWQLAADARVDLKIYDAAGRVRRTLASGAYRAGSYALDWNGADDAGRSLAYGIYFVRLATPARTVRIKAILTK
jgi:hypothetical protein